LHRALLFLIFFDDGRIFIEHRSSIYMPNASDPDAILFMIYKVAEHALVLCKKNGLESVPDDEAPKHGYAAF